MEQIDYKKKYEEAIERLKQYDREHSSGYAIKERDEFIFPELRESDDEKIRKDIISLVIKWWKDDGAVEPEFSTQNSMITWLEKQAGQKPGRWSDEDDWNTQVFINALELYNNPVDKVLLKSWIKSFKYKCKSQSKQEWSEEDKEITRSLLDIIYECHSYGKCALKLNEYSKLCNWLRFLKERCCPQKLSNVERNGEKWKLSDEQMEVLQWCMPLWAEPKSKAILESLINDLKKLREE